MLLTAQLQLIVSEAESNTLSTLVAACAGAGQDILGLASAAQVYRWLDINRITYHQIKASSGLPANLVQSLIRQVEFDPLEVPAPTQSFPTKRTFADG